MRSFKNKTYKPVLRIEGTGILEAAAAKIGGKLRPAEGWRHCAYREHTLTHSACKFCQNVFEVNSDHGRQFCPMPPGRLDLLTSTCKAPIAPKCEEIETG
jgi:hypothetical protein